MGKGLLFVSIMVFAVMHSMAQQTNTVVYDATQSEVIGAANLKTLHTTVYAFQDLYIPDTFFAENKPVKKVLGVGYRTLKCFLLDFQEDYLIALTQHEVFGHGARFRESGYSGNSFHLSLFYPFGDGGYARAGKLAHGEVITPQESITAYLGGNEANLVLASSIAEDVLLNHSMHYREALLYLIAQNNQLYYIWRTRLVKGDPTFPSGDIDNYLWELNGLYRSTGGKPLSVQDVSKQSLISLLNPLQLYSVFTLVYNYGIKAEKRLNSLPMIAIGNFRYLPLLNYSLTPFGSQYHFSNYVQTGKKLFAGELLIGDSRFHHFYGFNFRAPDLFTCSRLQAGIHAGIWNQPELELEDAAVTGFRHKTGGMVKADLHLRPFAHPASFGVFLQLGYKTKGYTLGEQLGEGLICRLGLSFVPGNISGAHY